MAVLSTASMSMLLLRNLGACPKKIFKITCTEIESEGISNILGLYIGVILTLAVHILAIAICSFVIISTSVATVLHILTQTAH